MFCNIVAKTEPADILFEDEQVMVFRNKLTWVPIMLLCIPKNHMTQAKLWTDPILAHVGKIAAYLAAEHCEEGFRILSNFGRHGLQSQEHGHLHMIGGVNLGSYA